MPDSEWVSGQPAELKVRWNQRSFWRNFGGLILIFLAYVALAVWGRGIYGPLGVVGAIVFGLVLLFSGVSGIRQFRRSPVAATLDEFGVTFARHKPAAWHIFREVRLRTAKPRLLFALSPLYYVAFVPTQTADLPRPTSRERLAVRLYGTNLLLLTRTVTPSADEILAAVRRLSDVPVRR